MSDETSKLPRQALWLVVTRGVSGLGTSLTTFGLDVWVFKQTGSYEIFAYLALITFWPNLLLAPFAGVLVDRCDKRKLLLACELVPMAAVSWALWQFERGALEVVGVAGTIFVLSVAGTVRWMVMGVTISILVPGSTRGRINALQQSFQGMSTMLGPILGAVGLALVGLDSLLVVDVATCLAAAIALGAIRSGDLRAQNSQPFEYKNFWREVTFGLRWVMKQPGLRRLMFFFMFFNLGVSVFSVVFTPYVLTFASSDVLGWGLAGQGAGAFFFGMALARWKGRSYPEMNVLVGALMFGALMVAWGLTRSDYAVVLLAVGAGALTSLIMSSSQTIWQSNVPVEIQGKVFSARMMVSFSLGPVAVLASVPFSIHVFGPILRMVPWTASVWGPALGGALGMMVSVLGAAVVIGCLALFARGGLEVVKPTIAPPTDLQPSVQ